MKDEWDEIHYAELTPAENDEIRAARRAGYALFYPITAPGSITLKGARKFMESSSPDIHGSSAK